MGIATMIKDALSLFTSLLGVVLFFLGAIALFYWVVSQQEKRLYKEIVEPFERAMEQRTKPHLQLVVNNTKKEVQHG